MIVTKQNYKEILQRLKSHGELSFDSETTGLLPFSGDRVFSIIIGISGTEAFYFNFNPLEPIHLLGDEEVQGLKELFADPTKFWYAHNALFDMHMVKESFDIDVCGDIFCTQTEGRVEYNAYFQYGLDASLKRIGLAKDDKVKKYIDEHKLKTTVPLDGKKSGYEIKHYEKVPFDIITEYALDDARGTFVLGQTLRKSIEQKGLMPVAVTEMRLLPVLHRLERTGILLDVPYINRAIDFERGRLNDAIKEFTQSTGLKFVDHFKTYEKVFASEREKFVFGEPTKTGQVNPTFDADILKKFTNPVVKDILIAKESKAKLNFYTSYLFFKDKNDVIHPHLNSAGADTGRFSSSNPNLQNITSEDLMTCNDCHEGIESLVISCPKCNSTNLHMPEFLVRRAFIPRPDYCFFNPDYSAQEFRLMLDFAKKIDDAMMVKLGMDKRDISYFELLRLIKEEDFDVHLATGNEVGIARKPAKAINFGLLYGMGVEKLGNELGLDYSGAQDMRNKYFKKLPFIKSFIRTVISTAERRGYVKNWAGRHSYFDKEFAYKAPNYIIQGGCADVMRIAMIGVDKLLQGSKSRQLLSIHDEILCEIHYSEVDKYPQRIIEVMEGAYPHDYLPLTASAEWSPKSLADKMKGFPHARTA